MIKVRDIIIIICLLMFSAALYFASGNKEGSTVLIEYDGNLFTEVNFTGLGDEEIFTYYLNGTTIIVDKNGAYFKESVCAGKVCVNSGRISKVGQIAICLPQRVSIRIEGNGREFDGITG
ncbi:MAG TPA: hypothetical protein DD733_11060 [Clostridiales bacterium]|nr:NusG domain II-containing protein [Eubacteriales bacterium]HBR32607.1 hypothetical protein [Clostridiales bacterium]